MTDQAGKRSGLGSIRFRAALLTLVLIAVALIAVISYAHLASRQILARTGESRASGVASQLAGLLGPPMLVRLTEIQRQVDDDAVRELITAPSEKTEQAAFARLQSVTGSAAMHQTLEIWTIGGRRVMARRIPETGSTVPLSDAAPAATGVRPYRLVEGGVVVSEVVVPIRGGGTADTIGYLLSRRLGTNPNTARTLSALVGDGGRVLLGNQAGTLWTDLTGPVAAPPIDVSSGGPHHYANSSGERVIAGFAPLSGTPLVIVTEFPEAFFIAPARVVTRQLALFAVVFIAIAVALVWGLSARVSKPVTDLTEAVRAVSAGDFSRRVDVHSNSEVGRLAEAFNAMAAQLESGLRDLEARTRELKAKDQRKAAMMNAALDCILTTDEAGTIVDCNPAAERVFGYDHAAIVTRNIGALLALPDYQPHGGLAEYVKSATALSLGTRQERTAMRANGTPFPAEVSLVAVQTDGVGFAAFVRDLTERKAAEAAARRSSLLEEENRRIHVASRLKSEFLANMSHELRTPLNAIIGFAELLYDGQVTPDMPEFKDFVHDILTSGQHLLQLINDVLDLSKVEAGRLEFHPEDTSLDQVVAETLSVVRTLAAQKKLSIAHDIDLAINHVFVDRGRLKQVLYNYVSNAIKFTPEGGRISIRAVPEGAESFRIDVIDTGIGIAEADLRRLFVEFNQLEAGAAKKHQGTGLGLALTRRLVEAQGGRVAVASTPGHGSTFSVVLPRRAHLGTPLADPRSIRSKRIGAPSVLVIEDDPADQEAIVQTLNEAGFNIETANSRAQALVKLSMQAFDAITLDLILPDASGADVLKDIRACDKNREVPVVVITIVAGGAVSGFAVHDILSKPVDGNDVIAALQRAGISAAGGGNVLVVDDDPGSLRLMAASLLQLGYRSTCLERAADALRLCEREAPLAVVLDLQMPEIDGFGFLDRFRAMPHCQDVPVIVWTVKDLNASDLDRLKASVQGIITKGHSGRSVVEELRRFVAPRPA